MPVSCTSLQAMIPPIVVPPDYRFRGDAVINRVVAVINGGAAVINGAVAAINENRRADNPESARPYC